MSSINQFFQETFQDSGLQQQLQSATDRESLVNKVVELGNQKGYSFSASDVEESLDSLAIQAESQAGAECELSEEELESVAGGFTPFAPLAILVTATIVRGAVKVGQETVKN
jgi:predicted ribosomally synthesized peptide with nif11-like leader